VRVGGGGIPVVDWGFAGSIIGVFGAAREEVFLSIADEGGDEFVSWGWLDVSLLTCLEG
jgi:hypothetical protein